MTKTKSDEFSWENPFKPEDFDCDCCGGCSPECDKSSPSTIANQRFRDLVKEHGKRVWGRVGVSSSWCSYPPGTFIQENYTHSAILIMIKPIEPQGEK